MFGEIRNQHGERIDYTYHPGQRDSKDLVIIGHGVTGNKDRPSLVALAEGLARGGISAMRISFAGNGQSEGRFGDSNIAKEVDDLGAVLDRVEAEVETIAYAGHSMGGAVGVLRASRDARIRFLVSLAGMVHTKAFAEREFGTVQPGQGCMWEDPDCPLSQSFMDDLRHIDSVISRGSTIRVPWLLVHGSKDDVVPLQDSRDMLAKAPRGTELFEIPGSTHVFDGEATRVMVDQVSSWLRGCFAG